MVVCQWTSGRNASTSLGVHAWKVCYFKHITACLYEFHSNCNSESKGKAHSTRSYCLNPCSFLIYACRFGGGPAVNHLYQCTTCLKGLEKLKKRQKYEIDTFIQVRMENTCLQYSIHYIWLRRYFWKCPECQ